MNMRDRIIEMMKAYYTLHGALPTRLHLTQMDEWDACMTGSGMYTTEMALYVLNYGWLASLNRCLEGPRIFGLEIVWDAKFSKVDRPEDNADKKPDTVSTYDKDAPPDGVARTPEWNL